MDSLDRQVLAHALAWHQAGYAVSLVTVVQTWGSAPRPVGAVLALRHDGVLSGSVSGGCVEDDLIARAKEVPTLPRVLTYGVSADDARRFGLPCGGTLQLVPPKSWPISARWPIPAGCKRCWHAPLRTSCSPAH